MKQFRLLTADDIECRVKKVTDKGAIILLYKTARTDMDILDETVGPENWDCDYREIKGNLYCGIGISIDGRVVRKWDCGIESREDDEGNQKKGEASDSFKRAGFKWGIGRELYTAPFIFIPSSKMNVDNGRTRDAFTVTHIEYDDKNDQSVQAVTARNEVLNKSIDAQKAKIETLRAALQNATDSFGENDKRTQNWTVQLNNAEAELNNMERELGETSSAADETGSKFEKLGGVLKGIGIAIGAAFVAVGTATVGAAKALSDMTVGASQYADEVLTMSTVTGLSTESLQAYKYAAELVDTSMETLTGSMARNIRSMTSAREGTGTAAAAYKALGISVTDASGNLRDSETVYWEAIDALGNDPAKPNGTHSPCSFSARAPRI